MQNLFNKVNKLINILDKALFGKHPYNRIFNYNWLLIRIIIRDLNNCRALIKGKMLDVGCGHCPYFDIFEPNLDEYIGMDIHEQNNNKPVSSKFRFLKGMADNIPLKDCSVDACLCSQVFSSLLEPEKAIKEISRVVRSGGYLILTVPHIMPLILEPFDFYRFTPSILFNYAKKYGFKIEKILFQGNIFNSFGLLLAMNMILSRYKQNEPDFKVVTAKKWILFPVIGFTNLFLFFLSISLGRLMPNRCPVNFLAIFKKL
jgi:SAM-dependent methyltransferase